MPDFNEIAEQLTSLPGHIGVYYHNLVTDERFAYHADDAFSAASVFKFPMMCAVADHVQAGDTCWEEKLVSRKEDRVPPCGALWFFDDEPTVSLRTLCGLMITISDNTATNMLIRRFTIGGLNADFRKMGLEKTHIERLLFDREASKRGLKNYFSPREMGNLLEKVYRGAQQGEAAAKFCWETLLQQQINHKIPGYLPDGAIVAHKTGEDDGITHDVGLVLAKRPFVLCFASNETDVPAAERCVRRLALELFEACGGCTQ